MVTRGGMVTPVQRLLVLGLVAGMAGMAEAQFDPFNIFGFGRQARPEAQAQRRPPPRPQQFRQQPQPVRQGRVVSSPQENTFSQQSNNNVVQNSQQTTFSRPFNNNNNNIVQNSQPTTFSRPINNNNNFGQSSSSSIIPSSSSSIIPSSGSSSGSSSSSSSSSSSGSSPPRGRVITIPLPKDKAGNDVYPDCNRGKVCLPVAEQCAVRQSRAGTSPFQNKTYWFSWQSDEEVLRKGSWNWFTARNYCRKQCMDLVSFETAEEWTLVKNFMEGAGIKEVWTSGRLCDSEVSGCEAEHYKPLNINGWFWASTLIKMLPTNRPIGLNPDGVLVKGVNEWAKTGDKGKPQPDGFTPEGGLGEEPCMAVIDGAWHDTNCQSRRAVVCEDLPQQNIQFVRNENPGLVIP